MNIIIAWVLLVVLSAQAPDRCGASTEPEYTVFRDGTARIPCSHGNGVPESIFWYHHDGSDWLLVVRLHDGQVSVGSSYSPSRVDLDDQDKSTLIIHETKIQDGGRYQCDTQSLDLYSNLIIIVNPQPPQPVILQVSKNAIDVELTCELQQFHPDDDSRAMIEWSRSSGKPVTIIPTETRQNADGTFNKSSSAIFETAEDETVWCNSTFISKDDVIKIGRSSISIGISHSVNVVAIVVPIVVVIVLIALVIGVIVYRKGICDGVTCPCLNPKGYQQAPAKPPRIEQKDIKVGGEVEGEIKGDLVVTGAEASYRSPETENSPGGDGGGPSVVQDSVKVAFKLGKDTGGDVKITGAQATIGSNPGTKDSKDGERGTGPTDGDTNPEPPKPESALDLGEPEK